ncbi:Cysteine/Histidine-rich C1 domain family protein [Rhynchospora pubera]|uniref:Cysteine/Histidine-rich C1 domain family protein n=1 Tax=Rhynchospora pubera TaxID=906938 RepID=A0AAV8FPZ7_9POAL|nr:Cysteine/Histidine-rich C1 domain family protein [Rhynchospora pubera]
MNHPSHPAHTLKLELTPPYPSGTFECDGCGAEGATFCLRCRECSFDLHLPCAAIPHTVNHPSDRHPLSLFYKPNPNISYYCGLCEGTVNASQWFYRCNICDYGGHVECFAPKTLEVLSSGLQTQEAPALTPQPPQLNLATEDANEIDNMLKFQKDMIQVQLELNKQRIMAEILGGFASRI